MVNPTMFRWNTELIFPPFSRLIYVGEITGLMSSKKCQFHALFNPHFTPLSMMVSQPIDCEKSFVVSILTERVVLTSRELLAAGIPCTASFNEKSTKVFS